MEKFQNIGYLNYGKSRISFWRAIGLGERMVLLASFFLSSMCMEREIDITQLKRDVCKTLMPPSPTWVGLTFDLALWSDLDINMDHLLIMDYPPNKFEACRTKHCWVISCIRYGRWTWPLTLTFDLLTWISIGIFYSSRTIYTYQVWSFWSYQLHKVKGDRHTDQRTDIPTDGRTGMCNAICPSFFKGGIIRELFN